MTKDTFYLLLFTSAFFLLGVLLSVHFSSEFFLVLTFFPLIFRIIKFPFSRKDRILVSFSDDGLSWTKGKVCVEYSKGEEMVYHAWVISAGKFFRMYYCGSKDNSSIVSATSKDGVKWERESGQRIRINGITHCRFPCVIRLEKGFIMYYAVSSNGKNYDIMLSKSKDGLNWSAGKRVLRRGGKHSPNFVTCPRVIPVADGFRMYYEGGFCNGKTNIKSAFSKNAFDWKKEKGIRIRSGGKFDSIIAGYSQVVREGNGFRMYYAGDGARGVSENAYYGGSYFRILSASSKDGLTWKKDAGVRLSPHEPYATEGVFSPQVLIIKGKKAMYYTGYWGHYVMEPLTRAYFFIKKALK